MAAKTWAERNIVEATAAFQALTGKSPNDAGAQDAWRVVWQALLSVGEPTAERSEWLAECAKPFHALLGVRKARVLPVLWALKETPDNYRLALQTFDARFGKLTDDEILDAFADPWRRRARQAPVGLHEASPKGWFAAIARVSLIVRGFDVERRVNEELQEAVQRIANTFRAEFDLHSRTKPKLKKPRK